MYYIIALYIYTLLVCLTRWDPKMTHLTMLSCQGITCETSRQGDARDFQRWERELLVFCLKNLNIFMLDLEFVNVFKAYMIGRGNFLLFLCFWYLAPAAALPETFWGCGSWFQRLPMWWMVSNAAVHEIGALLCVLIKKFESTWGAATWERSSTLPRKEIN